MIKKRQGFTLIEVIVFITLISLVAVALGAAFMVASRALGPSVYNEYAVYLAHQRLEIIQGYKWINDNTLYVDPCPNPSSSLSAASPDVCQAVNGYRVYSTISEDTNPTTITITVTEKGKAHISAELY